MSDTTTGKHTAGPWSVFVGSRVVQIDIGADPSGRSPCVVSWPGFDNTGLTADENRANARLIAAAPDLLDGCNALLGLIQLIESRDDLPPTLRQALVGNHRVEEALAAIRKATGDAA